MLPAEEEKIEQLNILYLLPFLLRALLCLLNMMQRQLSTEVSSFRKLVDMIIMIIYQCILCKYANATMLSFPSIAKLVSAYTLDFKR